MPDIADALDRLHHHDPAGSLSPLSIIERDLIRGWIVEVSRSHPAARSKARPPRQRRLRTALCRGRVIAAFAVVLVGGGVATAAILDQGTTTLVAHGLSCISATNSGTATSQTYNVPQNGESPTAACAPVIGVSASTLIACAKPNEGVVVFEANSDPADQCKSLGFAPLPTDYAAAITKIHELQQALTADYDRSDCISPSRLAQDANADLQRLGFSGWKTVTDTVGGAGQQYAGPCGDFPATGASISTADAALNASNHTVMIETGAPRLILQLAESVVEPAIDASGNQCYTLAGAQQLVRDMLDKTAGRTVPVEFAVTKEEPYTTTMGGSGRGPTAHGRQHYYDQGCTIVSSVGTAPDGQTFLVLLQNNAGPLIPNGQPPRASAYQSNLTDG